MAPQFVDISSFQGSIDFSAYAAWSSQWDGISRIAMKATEGVGFTDPLFANNRQGAIDAGIDVLFLYHFARPDLGNSALAEANWCHSVVGSIRPQDQIILDYEVEGDWAYDSWALIWLTQQQANYGKPPGIYASSAYIQARLQSTALAQYPLWLANWQFTPDERPPAPWPWASYEAVQYTDRAANIPGIAGAVDANIFLGGGPTNMELNLTDPFAATYFTGDDSTWHCSNGNHIFGGILTYYRQIQGAPRLPLSDENYDIPGCAYQLFEAGFIVYDPQNKLGKPAGAGDCYMVMLSSDLGQRLTGVQALKADLQALPALVSQMQTTLETVFTKILQDAGLPTS